MVPLAQQVEWLWRGLAARYVGDSVREPPHPGPLPEGAGEESLTQFVTLQPSQKNSRAVGEAIVLPFWMEVAEPGVSRG